MHFIRKKHSGIDLSKINFLIMKGHNIPDLDDGSTKVPEGVEDEADGDEDDEVDDSATLEGIEDTFGADLMVIKLTTNPSPSSNMNVPPICN